jgi:hypothetical protein
MTPMMILSFAETARALPGCITTAAPPTTVSMLFADFDMNPRRLISFMPFSLSP